MHVLWNRRPEGGDRTQSGASDVITNKYSWYRASEYRVLHDRAHRPSSQYQDMTCNRKRERKKNGRGRGFTEKSVG